MQRIRIALVQSSPPPRLDHVLPNVEAWVAKAAGEGSVLLVFPELYYPGFHSLLAAWRGARDSLSMFLDAAQPLPGPISEAIAVMAKSVGIHIVFTQLERDPQDGRLYNAAMLIGPDGALRLRHRKTMLTPHIEAGKLDRGDCYEVADTPIGRIGVLICADATCPEPARLLALRGADIVCVSSGDFRSPWQVDGRDMAEQIWMHSTSAPARALDNNFYWLAVNGAGTQSGCAFLGGSRIISPLGEIVAEAGRGPDAQELLCADIDLSLRERIETAFSVMKRRRPELYGQLVQPSAQDVH
jgi:predicted amidohydrolase